MIDNNSGYIRCYCGEWVCGVYHRECCVLAGSFGTSRGQSKDIDYETGEFDYALPERN